MKFKLGQKVRDTEKCITGIVCNIANNEVHLEFLKFKGDTEPFYLSYSTAEQDKLVHTYIENDKFNIDRLNHNLTIGDLRRVLKNTKLPDNAFVLVEHTNTGENQLTSYNVNTPNEVDFKSAWSINHLSDCYLGIYINY